MKSLILILTLAALPGFAATTRWAGNSEIAFAGTSTLHAWDGKVKAEPFVATVTTDAAGKPDHLTAKVQVKVAGMNTAEDGRDKNMRKAMKAEGFPLITGVMNVPFSKIMDATGKNPATLPFTLTLLGKEQQVNAKISQWKANEKAATFDLDFDLSLKACGITVPSVLLFIKVGDTIKLHATVKLQRTHD